MPLLINSLSSFAFLPAAPIVPIRPPRFIILPLESGSLALTLPKLPFSLLLRLDAPVLTLATAPRYALPPSKLPVALATVPAALAPVRSNPLLF